MQPPALYLITDRRATTGRELAQVAARVLAAVPPGAVMVQLRDKDLGGPALQELARRLRQVTAEHGARLLINAATEERLELALSVGADGVHLPEPGPSGPGTCGPGPGPGRAIDIAAASAAGGGRLVIGVSTHSPQAALAAARRGADLVVCGPVWATPSKAGLGAPVGLESLSAAAAALAGTRTRLYALGGVTEPARARAARAAGAHGVAGIRVFLAAADPGQAARALYHAMCQGSGPSPLPQND